MRSPLLLLALLCGCVATAAVPVAADPSGAPPHAAIGKAGGKPGEPQDFEKLSTLKSHVLMSLASGANKVHALLSSVGVNMRHPQTWMTSRSVTHREYEQMTEWWCKLQRGGKTSTTSNLCAKREHAQQLRTMSADAKKAAQAKAKHEMEDPATRKALSEEAKRMVDAYCKGSQVGADGHGAGTSICSKTVSVLDMSRRLFNRTLRAPPVAATPS